MTSYNLSQYTFPNNQPVVNLDCQQAFDGLTKKEKLYAHYLAKASWNGGLVVLVQTSPESPLIFSLLHKLYLGQTIPDLKQVAFQKCGFTEDEFTALLVYSSGIFTNMGNYKGFGDTKFIPNLPKNKFESLVMASAAFEADKQKITNLWNLCADAIFNISDNERHLGLGKKGVTTYFSNNCTMDDATFINGFLKEKGIEAYNSRLFKTVVGGITNYEVRLASQVDNDDPVDQDLLGNHEYNDCLVRVTRGDYSLLMEGVIVNLEKAKEYASNETEQKMLEKYIHSFKYGSLPAHKDGSRFWIKDKCPVIETYIGFIESYRDPAGQRGEFEGFVAMVNKAMSAKFGTLVSNAEKFLPCLPWPSSFEKNTFLQPDFTSLDVLCFSGSGIPAGINIPNYDEIRQSEGFKNVSLGNVIPASYSFTVVPFLSADDQTLLNKYYVRSFEVQVGLHELLGHGSGKLFFKNNDGTYNFDIDTVTNPLDGEKITTFYHEGETYDSKFTTLGSAYEECRAECVGLYLCLNRDILKIFGLEGEEADDIIYVNWLSLLWAGLRGLEMYQPENSKWGQAHSQARFAILQVLQEVGQNFVTLKETTGSDGKPDLQLILDRKLIETVGKEAIGKFLSKLQVYKSSGNVEKATEMFENYSSISANNKLAPFLGYRDIVVARRQPRKMFVQVNSELSGDDVTLKSYEATHEGLIQSWLDRFPSADVDAILEGLYEKDREHFKTSV